MAMRVYELAKKLGMENRVLIPELKKMGVSVSSHSSALDDETVQKVMEAIGSKSNEPLRVTEGAAAAKPVREGMRGKDVAVKAQSLGDPPKSDKRRILIKRKKEDEPTDVSPPAPVVEDDRSTQIGVDASVATSSTPVDQVSVPSETEQASPVEEAPATIAPTAPSPIVPQQEQ